MVDLRALGTEERKRRKGSVCAKRRTKLVGCGTCTRVLDLGKLVDSGARKGALLCVFCGQGEAASPLSAVSFLVCANPGVQLVAEYFAKFGKAAPPDRGFSPCSEL